ncbi:MAG: hypothetical protein KAR38_15155, partial [Calditrichia bacterium]|nr:hypothetical protein [Calditrichia bacterium]
HPLKKIKKSQTFFLKRGKWHNEDLLNKNIDGWQILNGKLDSGFRSGKKRWITALLSGEKKLISAGNDAHGNLNLFRQVKIPFINTEDNYYHQFGYFRTGLIHNNLSLNKKNILQTMCSGRIIVSSGPFINLCVKYDGQLFHIGDTLKRNKRKKRNDGKNKYSIDVHFLSTTEYGVISKIKVIHGNLKKGLETDIFNYENSNKEVIFEYKNSLEFIPNDGKQAYFRIEAETETGHFVLSNPIWYEL